VVVGEKSVARRQKLWKTLFVTAGMITMITISTAGWMGLLPTSLALSCILILTRCITLPQAQKAIQVQTEG